jgi:D-glycero-alpha-D-manno-heptose 1-phosphate guanylyltransferase
MNLQVRDLKPGLSEGMIREAVILAGGFGTRLKIILGEVPKPMAPVNNIPFIVYLLEQLNDFKFERVVLATGYKHEVMKSWLGSSYKGIQLFYSVEKEPLGTGGAIYKAAESINSNYFFVVNGDTFFEVDFDRMEETFLKRRSGLMLALKPMKNFDRYGSIVAEEERIASFNEKKFCNEGLINGGIYLICKEWLFDRAPANKFSFEKDILEKFVTTDNIGYYISEGYFVDIGIPEDYRKASEELPGLFKNLN